MGFNLISVLAKLVNVYLHKLGHSRFHHKVCKTKHFYHKELVGYTNVNWAGNIDVRRFTLGFAFSLGSVVVAWSSKKQLTVALSRIEVRYRGVVFTTCEAIWLNWLLKDLRVEVSDPTTI